jgi:hypothetical protein
MKVRKREREFVIKINLDYNIMFPSSCLLGLSLATILLQVATFEIQIGTAAQLLK